MKTLYIECNMGAAGDMLTAALLELLPDQDAFLKKVHDLRIPGVQIAAKSAFTCGIQGTRAVVTVHGMEEESHDVHSHAHTHDHEHHEHHHTSMHDITHLLEHLALSEKVRSDVLAVYQLIAQAESHAHGKPVEEIHFHEVGTMDAIADIICVCMLMEQLAPEKVIASPVHVGSGQVQCAHGILPVPTPATGYILKNVPIYGGEIQGELCTPTGAALLKHFVSEYGSMPVMRIEKIGYGIGKKSFPQANCVRVMLGETADTSDTICELKCNLDDMTPEAIGFAQEQLLAGGALDVFTTAIGMKKSRPGILLTCLCKPEQKEEILRRIFRHTTTLGIRENLCKRHILRRTFYTKETAYGSIRMKAAEGYGIRREKPEYEDLARIARETGVSIADIQIPTNTECHHTP